MTEKAVYFDSSKCTACKGCQVACKTWNNLPSPLGTNEAKWSGTHQNPVDLNGDTRLTITFNELEGDSKIKPVKWAFGRRACQHCTDAPCASVCPGGALVRNEETGFVEVYQDKCVGCQYCHSACPFDVPRYESNGLLDKTVIDKCTGCADRVAHGMAPACVSAFQPNALQFGDRDEMIAKGKEKVAWLHESGYPDAGALKECSNAEQPVLRAYPAGIPDDALADAAERLAGAMTVFEQFDQATCDALARVRWDRLVAASDMKLAGNDPSAYVESFAGLLQNDGLGEDAGRMGAASFRWRSVRCWSPLPWRCRRRALTGMPISRIRCIARCAVARRPWPMSARPA